MPDTGMIKQSSYFHYEMDSLSIQIIDESYKEQN